MKGAIGLIHESSDVLKDLDSSARYLTGDKLGTVAMWRLVEVLIPEVFIDAYRTFCLLLRHIFIYNMLALFMFLMYLPSFAPSK